MGTTSSSTLHGTAGAQSPEAQRMMQLLGQAVQQGANSPDVRGDFSIDASQQGLINQAQASAGGVARSDMEQNLEAILRQLEDSNIGRQITGGSLEAVNNAVVGGQQLRDVNSLGIQQAGQAAQQAINLPFQASEATNRALLARLVQPAQMGLNYDAAIRQLNQSTYGEQHTPFDYVGMANAIGEAIPG